MRDHAYAKAKVQLVPQRTSIGSSSKSNLLQGNSSAQKHGHLSKAACDRASHFGHDFSRIPIHPLQAVVPQTKLTVNQPGDAYEQEASQVAEQVMRMDNLRPEVSDDESETRKPLMRKQSTVPLANASAIANVPPIIHGVLNSGGERLDMTTRAFMEPRFEHDFSQVRVHTNARAAESAQAVNALAYTVGRDVVFGAGQFSPRTSAGRKLVAHELAHVVQQSAIGTSAASGYGLIQRAPAPSPKPTNRLGLPWTHGNVTLFEETGNGIRVLAGVETSSEKRIRGVIPSITKQIATDNMLIKDVAFQVKTCFIVPTTTRFALLKGDPVLMLDPSDADSSTAAHEMGHAVFDYLSARGASGTSDAPKAENFRLRIADIYHRLKNTQEITIEGPGGKKEKRAVGHWIVDPSQWKPGSKFEHPWDDPDEFFASAKEAYQTGRAGLRGTIARFTKIDNKVRVPAEELLDLLDAFFGKGKLPLTGLSKVGKATAEGELGRASRVSKVEDTVMEDSILDWLLNPESRPGPEEAAPSVAAPHTGPGRTEYPNLVTGPGGVVEQMEKRFQKRIHEKILESAEELP